MDSETFYKAIVDLGRHACERADAVRNGQRLGDEGERFEHNLDAVIAGWPTDEFSALGRISGLCDRDRTMLGLLALAAAPALEPTLAARYRQFAAPLTIGAILELASESERDRFYLARRFDAHGVMIARALIEIDDTQGAKIDTEVAVPGSVIAAIRGIENGLPPAVLDAVSSDGELPEDSDEVPTLTGNPLLFVGEDDPELVARIVAVANRKPLWICRPPETRGEWVRLFRDAAIAGAAVTCDLEWDAANAATVVETRFRYAAAAARRFAEAPILFVSAIDAVPAWALDDVTVFADAEDEAAALD